MAKVLVTSAVGMILSLGLCKLGFWQDRNVHDGGPNTLDTVGGLGFVLGLLLFLVTLLVVAVAVLSRAVKKGLDR